MTPPDPGDGRKTPRGRRFGGPDPFDRFNQFNPFNQFVPPRGRGRRGGLPGGA